MQQLDIGSWVILMGTLIVLLVYVFSKYLRVHQRLAVALFWLGILMIITGGIFG